MSQTSCCRKVKVSGGIPWRKIKRNLPSSKSCIVNTLTSTGWFTARSLHFSLVTNRLIHSVGSRNRMRADNYNFWCSPEFFLSFLSQSHAVRQSITTNKARSTRTFLPCSSLRYNRSESISFTCSQALPIQKSSISCHWLKMMSRTFYATGACKPCLAYTRCSGFACSSIWQNVYSFHHPTSTYLV